MSEDSTELAAARRELAALSAENEAELAALGEATRNQRAQAEADARRQEQQFRALAQRVREIAAARDNPKAGSGTLDFSPEDEEAVPESAFEREAAGLATLIPPKGHPATAPEAETPEPPTPPEAPPRPAGRRRLPRDLDDEDDMSEQTWLT